MIGGPGYKWRGKNIRVITHNDVRCVTMPRVNSAVLATVTMNTNSTYSVTINAKNSGGTGRIEISVLDSNRNAFSVSSLYIVSPGFKKYVVELDTNDMLDVKSILIGRIDSSGGILVESISYSEVPRVVETSVEEYSLSARMAEKRIALGKAQLDISLVQRKERTDNILIARGDKMPDIHIGGRGYRWRGKQIKTLTKHNDLCVDLMRPNSMVLCPVTVNKNIMMSVTIKASASKADCPILVNFFGGKKYDGVPVRVNVSGNKLKTYTTNICVPDFPPNLPMNLRVWRPGSAVGSIFIKTIDCEYYSEKAKAKVKPAPQRPRVSVRRPKPPPVIKKRRVVNKKMENNDMRFRPYGVGKKINQKSKDVLIYNKDQVPMVSIITPTRNGRELLERCYDALNKNTAYPNWEWVVGDSESTDGSIAYIEGLNDPRIKLIKRGTTNGSFSSINNELAKESSGEYYLFLNNDTRPQEFWLFEMMSKIHRHPDIGVVGARLKYKGGTLQHAGIMFTGNGPVNVSKPVLRAFGAPFIEQDRYYQAVTAACMLMRADDFHTLNGFDPVYYFCYEDVDLCLRVGNDLGKKILYAANAHVFHDESVTQNKHSTSGDRQNEGIVEFKKRWMHRVDIDFDTFVNRKKKDIAPIDMSFVTCVNNLTQYRNYIAGSLFMNNTNKRYEIIPIMNMGNPHSAASALNLGISKSRGNIIVMCHQDVVFYSDWVETLFARIKSIEKVCPKWGVLGTAGITAKKDNTIGIVRNLRGKVQWQQTVKADIYPVQTVDEHCMIIRRDSGLLFDQKAFDGFHCYGPDICLNALSKGMKNYGILCPLVHNSYSGSLASGEREFMRLLAALGKKWSSRFPSIRTTTSLVRGRKIQTFIKFK